MCACLRKGIKLKHGVAWVCVAVEVVCNWNARVFVDARVKVYVQVKAWWVGDSGYMSSSTMEPDELTVCVGENVPARRGACETGSRSGHGQSLGEQGGQAKGREAR